MIPDAIEKFIKLASRLPGIGPRQATRLGFFLAHQEKSSLEELIKSLSEIKSLKLCAQCFLPHASSNGLCPICRDPKRDFKIIAIVEKETDLISLEQTKQFNGRYLVIGDLRKDGVLESEQRRRLTALKDSLKGDPAKEIILAFSPTTYGDLNASVIAQEVRAFAEKITRLGRGIPTGGEVEFADDQGRTYAQLALPEHQLLVLHYQPQQAA